MQCAVGVDAADQPLLRNRGYDVLQRSPAASLPCPLWRPSSTHRNRGSGDPAWVITAACPRPCHGVGRVAQSAASRELASGAGPSPAKEHRALGVIMIPNVVWVAPLDGYRLHLRFDDGVEGTFDLPPRIEFTGVFEPLRDPAFFARVAGDPEGGAGGWPNGGDLDPLGLCAAVTG